MAAPLPGLKTIGDFHSYLAGQGFFIDWKPIAYAFAFLNIAFLFLSPSQTFRNYEFLLFFAPLWLPVMLLSASSARTLHARRAGFLAKQKYVLLELRLPRDTQKTPLAMETFFANMNFGPGESTKYKVNVLGNIRPWWSFEIASIGGQVHFYIWTREAMRRSIESLLYAQYPGMEIIEAEDYSRLVDPSDGEHSLFGEEFVKSHANKDAQADPYPIKTYVDYGLDKAGTKPEEQIDPLSQIIELLGSIGPKEQYWIQFIVRQSKTEKHGEDWKKIGQKEIEQIREKAQIQNEYVDSNGVKQKTTGFPNPTEGQKDAIKSIERNINKAAFDIGIRVIYSAPKDAYQGVMPNFILSMWKPFTNENGAGFKSILAYSAAFNDYPWEDPKHIAHDFVEKKIVNLYRQRAYFNQPYNGPWSIMSSEELATLYHIPSSTIQTPGLPRLQSSTAGAPSNLPV